MENQVEKNQVKQRKPYEKPRLERVRLVAEEAVLGGCKAVSQGGPTTLDGCAPVGSCVTIAS